MMKSMGVDSTRTRLTSQRPQCSDERLPGSDKGTFFTTCCPQSTYFIITIGQNILEQYKLNVRRVMF